MSYWRIYNKLWSICQYVTSVPSFSTHLCMLHQWNSPLSGNSSTLYIPRHNLTARPNFLIFLLHNVLEDLPHIFNSPQIKRVRWRQENLSIFVWQKSWVRIEVCGVTPSCSILQPRGYNWVAYGMKPESVSRYFSWYLRLHCCCKCEEINLFSIVLAIL